MYGAAPHTHRPRITPNGNGIDLHVPWDLALDGNLVHAPEAWRVGLDLWSSAPEASTRRLFPALSAETWAAIEAGRARWCFDRGVEGLRCFPLVLGPDPVAPMPHRRPRAG